MVQQRSNIGTTLNKKRHISLMKKVLYYFIFFIFFISLMILGLTTNRARINNIVVSGNSSVSTEDIMKLVDNELNKNYLWIIPTDNIFLLRRNEIKDDILNNIKKIGLVNVYVDGTNKISLAVVEREARNLWCDGIPTNSKTCYFIDSNGFVFEESPIFSEGTFAKYFGLINSDNPIGQSYFQGNFKNISGLYGGLKNMLFQPKYFNALSDKEYEVYIDGGGKILINNSKSFDSSLQNLQALINNGYIKTDAVSISKIKFIDLRFGNKVNFELYK